MGSLVEIRVLQALVCQSQGDTPAALEPLARALELAEPQGYVRLFIDEGPPMTDLLHVAAQKGIAETYVERLLRAFGEGAGELDESKHATRPAAGTRPLPLVEPLSERELEVLRLLGTEMSGPEIADALYVSLNTLRTHTKNIYGKLGTNSRRAAVRRAEELGLL